MKIKREVRPIILRQCENQWLLLTGPSCYHSPQGKSSLDCSVPDLVVAPPLPSHQMLFQGSLVRNGLLRIVIKSNTISGSFVAQERCDLSKILRMLEEPIEENAFLHVTPYVRNPRFLFQCNWVFNLLRFQRVNVTSAQALLIRMHNEKWFSTRHSNEKDNRYT